MIVNKIFIHLTGNEVFPVSIITFKDKLSRFSISDIVFFRQQYVMWMWLKIATRWSEGRHT